MVQQTSTQNFFQSSSFLNNQSQNSDTRSGNHRFYFNFEYQIDSFNYIKISPNVTYSNSKASSNTVFDYAILNGAKTSDGLNQSRTETQTPNLSANILFNHRFHKKGRNLSVNLNAGTSQNNSDQYTQNSTSVYNGPN